MSLIRALVLVGGLLVTMPAATAQATVYQVESVVYWTGPSCIPVMAPQYPNGRSMSIVSICGGYSDAHHAALDGEYVGADPMPNDATVTLGCSVYVNGRYSYGDFAPSGDKHDVNCLRYLPDITNAQQRGA